MEKRSTAHLATSFHEDATIYIVDDDMDLCSALVGLFNSVSLTARCFASSKAFLAALPREEQHGCILLDVRLPGLNGLDLQEHLDRVGNRMPIIFMTGYGDIPMTVRALKAGAANFLEKPFRQHALLEAVSEALAKDLKRTAGNHDADHVRKLATTLTPREAEVMHAVVAGMMNKQIAFDLGIKEITVKLHRGSVMRKMQATSLAELVRKAAMLDRP